MARFIGGTYMDDPTNWWIYGPQCLEGMVKEAGSILNIEVLDHIVLARNGFVSLRERHLGFPEA